MGYLDTAEHKNWSKAIRERDQVCLVCGTKDKLSAHHLIPKENEKTRSDLMNGITLCFKHHMKWGHDISPHSHGSLLFAILLEEKRPNQWKWVKDNWTHGV